MAGDSPVVIRTKKFLRNPLLGRRQFVLDIIHPGRANVPKAELQEKLAEMYKVADTNLIQVFGSKTQFGGGKTTAFCLVYDNVEVEKKFEPKYRLARNGLGPERSGSRKQIKELKNKNLKVWGTGRRANARKLRKAAAA
jgi:small subunit ribosomal protein S24e